MAHARARTRILALAVSLAAFSATVALAAPSHDQHRKKIQHIVVVMMENRSFDHFLGWHPTADGTQEGLLYPDHDGILYPTYPLAPDFMGCGHPDPDHTWVGGREQYNGGAMDGFLRSGDNDEYAIGYYRENDRPFFNALARHYTTLDRMFSSILGPTYPNRIFLHAAQTDRLSNTFSPSTLPTIWDKLAAKGISRRYYVSDASFLLMWGTKDLPIHATYSQFLQDAASGNLPKVSFVEPRFLLDELGTSGSDHPYADVREGDAWLARTFHALTSSPQWKNTVFIVTYDEWGGFFDHVAPPRARAPNNVDPDLVNGKALLGLRIPALVVSPYSKGNPNNPRVVSTVFDHTSILKLIEWRFGLTPLTLRDASNDVGNLLDALSTTAYDASVPNLPMPPFPSITPCIEFPDAADWEPMEWFPATGQN